MASEVFSAREVTKLKDVRNAEGKVTGREVVASSKGFSDPLLAMQPFTQFMTRIGRRDESDMPIRRNSYRMRSGNTMTVGVEQDGSYAHVRVRDANNSMIVEAKNLKNDKELQSFVGQVWRRYDR